MAKSCQQGQQQSIETMSVFGEWLCMQSCVSCSSVSIVVGCDGMHVNGDLRNEDHMSQQLLMQSTGMGQADEVTLVLGKDQEVQRGLRIPVHNAGAVVILVDGVAGHAS